MWVTSAKGVGVHSHSGPRVVRVAVPRIMITNGNGGVA
jgi:hypothetical protein